MGKYLPSKHVNVLCNKNTHTKKHTKTQLFYFKHTFTRFYKLQSLIFNNHTESLCMNITRKLLLPDHDFPPASKHYFIPSCYKLYDFKKSYTPGSKDCFTYNGAMKIFLRCGYYEKENAYHHGEDLENIFNDPKYYKWTHVKQIDPESGKSYYHANKLKPILIIRTDNAKDMQPNSPKVQQVIYYLFKFSKCPEIYLLKTHNNIFNI